jgi:phenylpropionate dioxygenase-like ring-hydroxylating dioxygenase large terminal subunit
MSNAELAFNALLQLLMLHAWNPYDLTFNPPLWSVSTLFFLYLCVPFVAPRLVQVRHPLRWLAVLTLLYLLPPLWMIANQAYGMPYNKLSSLEYAWRYDLTGALVGVPLAQGFPTLDPATRGLKRLPSTVRHGLIWAVLDPAQTSIDVPGLLGGVDDDLAAMDLGSHRFFRQRVQTRATNWKLVMDAFQEVYHIKRLHARTIAPFFLHAKSAGDAVGPHLRILVAREQLPDAQALPPEAWDVRRHATLTHGIFPNSMVIYHPDSTSHLGMFPTAPGEITFVHTMFTPHAARNDKEQAHWDRTFDMIDGGVFSAEDLFISEQIQQGVASGANDSFVLGRFEQHLRRFHGHVQDMLRG